MRLLGISPLIGIKKETENELEEEKKEC